MNEDPLKALAQTFTVSNEEFDREKVDCSDIKNESELD